MSDSVDPESGNIAGPTLRLADFIRLNVEMIVSEWSAFAKTRRPASDTMAPLALQDHVRGLLDFIALDIESFQSATEQVAKSKGSGPIRMMEAWSAAEIHASLRLDAGFDIDQMVSEYRALRASVIKIWLAAKHAELTRFDLDDLIRFNEAVDQAITESIALYTKLIDETRDLFIGILGHDLRSPIGAAMMGAKVAIEAGGLSPQQNEMMSDVMGCLWRANGMVADLLDLTRVHFGTDLAIDRQAMEMADAARDIVAEMGVLYPSRAINLTLGGDTRGRWDRSRVERVFSNLVDNALVHGFAESVITVAVQGEADHVTISVHNEGDPIPADQRAMIFESLVRESRTGRNAETAHLGLGLYIVNRIVEAHGGTITVDSTAESGTTFTVRLPRG